MINNILSIIKRKEKESERNRKKRRIHAPDFEEMLEDNEALKEILNKGGVQKATTNIELSLA
jgi:hypothetical protein